MEKVTIWIHIPKTGGKSMVKMLAQKYKTLQVYETLGGYVHGTDEESLMDKIVNLKYVMTLDECFAYASANGYDAVIGNIEAPKAKESALKHYGSCELYCVLRDPIERAYSDYCHETFYGLKEGYVDFCKRTSNTQFKRTGGDLSMFKFVGRFENFESELAGLGFVVEHENKPDGKPRIDVDKEIAREYNLEDIRLYGKFMNNKNPK